MRWLVLVVVGCAPHIAVEKTLIGGEFQPRDGTMPPPQHADDCKATREVTVVTPLGAAVRGALIEVEQRVSEHAIEETLAVWRYRTVPVTTDGEGKARICDPGELFPEPHFQGWGGGYTSRGTGEIRVTLAQHRVVVSPPFSSKIVLP